MRGAGLTVIPKYNVVILRSISFSVGSPDPSSRFVGFTQTPFRSLHYSKGWDLLAGSIHMRRIKQLFLLIARVSWGGVDTFSVSLKSSNNRVSVRPIICMYRSIPKRVGAGGCTQ